MEFKPPGFRQPLSKQEDISHCTEIRHCQTTEAKMRNTSLHFHAVFYKNSMFKVYSTEPESVSLMYSSLLKITACL